MGLDPNRRMEAFGFTLEPTMRGGRRATMARFSCYRCDAFVEVNPRYPIAPEYEAKRVAKMGWKADGWRKSVTLCPDCQAQKKDEKPMATPPPAAMQLPAEAPAKPAAAPPPAKVTPMDLNRQPTPDQRAAIRKKLDEHFDDAVGRYLDGYSDHRISEELKLPRIFVERAREAAYGPIRQDPALLALQEELAGLRTRIVNAEATLADMRIATNALASKIAAALEGK